MASLCQARPYTPKWQVRKHTLHAEMVTKEKRLTRRNGQIKLTGYTPKWSPRKNSLHAETVVSDVNLHAETVISNLKLHAETVMSLLVAFLSLPSLAKKYNSRKVEG